MVPKESEDLLDYLDFQEHLDFQGFPDRTDLQAREEWRDVTAPRVTGVSQEVQESQDCKDGQVHLVFQDQRENQAI